MYLFINPFLFSSPERHGMDISSPYHMMALQHLFRLNWNAHPMRTRHKRSPNQLLIIYPDINAPPCDYVNIDDVIAEAKIISSSYF